MELVLSILSVPLTVALSLFLAFRYLEKRDREDWKHREAERAERAVLANRIQAPETAVAQTLMPEEVMEKPYRSEDDEIREFEHKLAQWEAEE